MTYNVFSGTLNPTVNQSIKHLWHGWSYGPTGPHDRFIVCLWKIEWVTNRLTLDIGMLTDEGGCLCSRDSDSCSDSCTCWCAVGWPRDLLSQNWSTTWTWHGYPSCQLWDLSALENFAWFSEISCILIFLTHIWYLLIKQLLSLCIISGLCRRIFLFHLSETSQLTSNCNKISFWATVC